MEPRKASSLTWLYIVALFIGGTLLGLGIYRAIQHHAWDMLAAGCVTIVAVAVTWPIAHALQSAGRQAEVGQHFTQLTERLDGVLSHLTVIREQQLLSDRAKSVAYRGKDREAMRHAIQEEINAADWDAALALAEDIESEFGYKSEAARFRDEIRQRRQEQVRKQVQDAIAVIDRHTRAEQWTQALKEAERLIGVFPENEQVRNLPAEIDQRRQMHKKQLLDNWHEAVARHDIDGSIEILKQLDTYLTPVEAEGLQETARQVFKEKLNMLGKQFADSVHEQRWRDAIRVGEQIIAEYPNARIAQEVREKMAVLRQRASEPAGSPAGMAPVTATAPAAT